MERKQFIYVIKPIPNLLIEENWTKKEEDIINRHFQYLKNLLHKGKLILAGKTDGLDEKTFGIVIIEAKSNEEAKDIMNNDPGVLEGIMIPELYNYSVAIMKKYK